MLTTHLVAFAFLPGAAAGVLQAIVNPLLATLTLSLESSASLTLAPAVLATVDLNGETL